MSRPWMPMYWGDYFRDTLDLTTVEHGMYLLLIGHYWQHGTLPSDDLSLSKIVGADIRLWRAHREAIASKFQPEWKHRRIEEEILRAEKKTMLRALAGRKGGTASSVTRTKTKRPLRKSADQNEANASQLWKQPATNHKERKITTTTTVAARETAAVENKGQPRKEAKEEKRLIDQAEYMARVGNK